MQQESPLGKYRNDALDGSVLEHQHKESGAMLREWMQIEPRLSQWR